MDASKYIRIQNALQLLCLHYLLGIAGIVHTTRQHDLKEIVFRRFMGWQGEWLWGNGTLIMSNTLLSMMHEALYLDEWVLTCR